MMYLICLNLPISKHRIPLRFNHFINEKTEIQKYSDEQDRPNPCLYNIKLHGGRYQTMNSKTE